MLNVKDLQNQQKISGKPYRKVGIEFDLLLLAMLTVFDLELTENQIYRNFTSLLKQLNLPVKKNLASTVRSSLSFLLSNELILLCKKGSYIISEKGEPLGMRALMRFQQNFKN